MASKMMASMPDLPLVRVDVRARRGGRRLRGADHARFGPGNADRLDEEVAVGLAVRQPGLREHELERVEELEARHVDADGLPPLGQVDDGLARDALEQRVDELDELVERGPGRERHELVEGNVGP